MTTANERKDRICAMWRYGHRGFVDFSKKANKVTLPGITPFKMSPKSDMESFDLPISDVNTFKNKANKNVYFGGKGVNRLQLGVNIKDVMKNSFSQRELGKMNLYFDVSKPAMNGCVGQCTTYTSFKKPKSIITIDKNNMNEDVIIHEMVHARRVAMGDFVKDVDKEEKETDFETVMRMQKPELKKAGYYQYLPGCMHEKSSASKRLLAVLSDRKLSGKKTPYKGKPLQKNIQNLYNMSLISTAKIGLSTSGGVKLPSEDIDRYFIIKTSKETIRKHIRFNKKVKLSTIKKSFKKQYGNKITVWEYHDGRKVLILKPTKSKNKKVSKKQSKKKVSKK